MGADHDIPGVIAFGKGRGDYQLPCGYVDAEGKVHNTVIIRETTGHEEDILDDDQLSTTERITRVLSSCCEKLGDITDKGLISRAVGDKLGESEGVALSQADRMAMMLFLRRTTNGDRYNLPDTQRVCPYCKGKNNPMHVDLHTDITIKYAKDPSKRRVRFTLPRRGEKAVLRVLSARGEEKLTKLMRGKNKKDLRSLAILARLEKIGDVTLREDFKSVDTVRKLSSVDRNFIREVYNKIEGAIDTELEMTCEKIACGREWKTEIDIGQVFFSPQDVKITEADLEWI